MKSPRFATRETKHFGIHMFCSIRKYLNLVGGTINQSINQSINRSIDRSIDRSVNQSIYRSIDRSINLSIYLSYSICLSHIEQHTNCLGSFHHCQSPFFLRTLAHCQSVARIFACTRSKSDCLGCPLIVFL